MVICHLSWGTSTINLALYLNLRLALGLLNKFQGLWLGSMLKGLISRTWSAARSKHLVSIVSPTFAHGMRNDSHNYTECQKAKFTENDRFKVKFKQN